MEQNDRADLKKFMQIFGLIFFFIYKIKINLNLMGPF